MLPLPSSSAVPPDEVFVEDGAGKLSRVRLRGTFEWAPPRAQWVFKLHRAQAVRYDMNSLILKIWA